MHWQHASHAWCCPARLPHLLAAHHQGLARVEAALLGFLDVRCIAWPDAWTAMHVTTRTNGCRAHAMHPTHAQRAQHTGRACAAPRTRADAKLLQLVDVAELLQFLTLPHPGGGSSGEERLAPAAWVAYRFRTREASRCRHAPAAPRPAAPPPALSDPFAAHSIAWLATAASVAMAADGCERAAGAAGGAWRAGGAQAGPGRAVWGFMWPPVFVCRVGALCVRCARDWERRGREETALIAKLSDQLMEDQVKTPQVNHMNGKQQRCRSPTQHARPGVYVGHQ